MSALVAWAQRRSITVAWIASAVAIVATATSLVLADRNGTLGVSFTEQLSLILAFYVYLVVGLVLIVKRPQHRISWLMLSIGLLPTVGVAVQEYVHYAVVVRPGLPGVMAGAWFNQWWWYLNLGLIFVFLPLVFPTGHLPTPRWRWVSRTAVVALTLLSVLGMLAPTYTGQTGYEVHNPFGVPWASEDGAVGGIAFAVAGLCMLATLVSLGVRFRRSSGIERQQLKWFVYAGALTIGLPLLSMVGLPESFSDGILSDLALSLPPLAMGLAIARYRLYDIDRVISRTVTYALLTILLVGLYLAAVTSLTALTAPVAGESPIAVAAATLLAAAAFGPARKRIQHGVDRRFNRARYDAAQTVEEFRAHLRDELELTAITQDLQHTIGMTVQPTRSVVWLASRSGVS